MDKAGYAIRETDPFQGQTGATLSLRETSPYVNRVRLLWEAMRQSVIDIFPAPPGIPSSADTYITAVEAVYANDAYHSLSIEGYRVSAELIDRVRQGHWNPESTSGDRENRNALAARGYYDAFISAKTSVERVLRGETAAEVAREDHADWYRQLFGPGVTAGIIKATDLAGYRTGPVYIRRSMHVPPPRDAVRDCMPALFDLLAAEPEPAVRVVLGHFVFVYIHPYSDGNGRIGRFLMNVMLASGGYPWTVIPVQRRDEYMAALEAASVHQDIRPFALLVSKLVQSRLSGQGVPKIPMSPDGH